MHYSLRQPASDKQTATSGSSIFSNKEWDELGCDLKLSPRALQCPFGRRHLLRGHCQSVLTSSIHVV